MEIHLSDKFSGIEVVRCEDNLITIQCALWPSWSDLHQATKDELTFKQLRALRTLFGVEAQSRDFEVVDNVLKIRYA